jgi:hypothetical protein
MVIWLSPAIFDFDVVNGEKFDAQGKIVGLVLEY